MNQRIALCIALALACALNASAETRESSSTAYNVGIDQGEVLDQPNGQRIRIGVRSHANVLGSSGVMAGLTASQWCDGMQMLDAAGQPTVNVGYCTLVYDNGDRLWVSYLNKPGQPGNWWVIGGTGRFDGATGSGSGSLVSQRGDGRSWTSQSKGTITTK
jgi:hypothetical protein